MPSKAKPEQLAIIVVGNERSGTRLATRLCIAAGCYGDAGADPVQAYGNNPQRYDWEDPAGESPIVIRRSLPYHPGRQWPDLPALIKRLSKLGYTVKLLHIERDEAAQCKSVVAHHYCLNGIVARKERKRAAKVIAATIKRCKVKCAKVSYDDLCKSPATLYKKLCSELGLKHPGKLPETIKGHTEDER